MARLSVNVNKVATLRNARPGSAVPSVARCAAIALQSGAAGVTVHPRPDARHIRPDDVSAVAEVVKAFCGAEFNIEGNPFEGDYLRLCRQFRPAQCTLVPDAQVQATSDHGWNLPHDVPRLKPVVAELKALGCRVSLFADADERTIGSAVESGADRVELYTEPYAAAFARGEAPAVNRFAAAARAARAAGLGINAGHDLNLLNLAPFIRSVEGVLEVSIGHALIADALEFGLAEAVRRYLRAADGRDA
jgi:pyridoxine 5-phosphate synthase